MAYVTGLPYEQTSRQPTAILQFEDEAFELAFAEAENAVHVAEVEPEIEAEMEEQSKLTEKEEADRLAKTAGELFDRLQYERETNEKFRNSSFMALMKKLRDREVVVEGNKMVDSTNLNSGEEKFVR
jgi:peroxin-5